MPTLPLPFPVLVTGGDLPVRDAADVLAQLPPEIRETTGPVRDALAAGAAEILIQYQGASDYAAAQSDATLATGNYLAGITGEVGIHPHDGEDDEALRDRYFAIPAVVTPNAIKRLIGQIIAPYTTKRASVFESVLDRWYVTSGVQSWACFLSETDDIAPSYADRRYDLRPNSSPGGAWTFPDHQGRLFVVRLPVIEIQAAYAFDGAIAAGLPVATVVPTGQGWFVSDGTVTDGHCNGFVFSASQAAYDVYQIVISTLAQIKGAGVRFLLIIDPTL